MKQLYAITGTFKPRKHSKPEPMLAICEDVDTPVAIFRVNGKPYQGKNVWSYDLHHHLPWAKFEFHV